MAGSKVAIYVRVSTRSQSTGAQRLALAKVAATAKWKVVQVFADEATSGAVAPNERSGLSALLQAACRREFDKVMVWSVDRLGRSVKDLINVLHQLKDCGVELYSHQQALDTSTVTGRMMWQFLSIFADFEREMIRERVKAGIERARHRGVRLGRPTKAHGLRSEVVRLRAKGMGKIRIGRELGLGTGTVSKILSEASA